MTTVARFRSRTDPTRSYLIRQDYNGVLRCECPGFYFRGRCVHLDAATIVYATRTRWQGRNEQSTAREEAR